MTCMDLPPSAVPFLTWVLCVCFSSAYSWDAENIQAWVEDGGTTKSKGNNDIMHRDNHGGHYHFKFILHGQATARQDTLSCASSPLSLFPGGDERIGGKQRDRGMQTRHLMNSK